MAATDDEDDDDEDVDDENENADKVLMPKIIISKNLKHYSASGSQNPRYLKGV